MMASNIELTSPLPNHSRHNFTSEFNLLESLGPKRDHLYVIIPVSICYAVIFVTGLIGNVCTCVVICRNRYMHTATNFYLFSLAVSDLLLLILGLPQEFYELWSRYPYIFGNIFCILRGMAAETSANASVLTITAFTIERYIAICHPIQSHTMSRLSRAIKLIIFDWIVAALCAIPIAIQFGIVYVTDETDQTVLASASCAVKSPLSHSFEISTVFFFLLPMSILTVLYILIGIQLRKSTAIGRDKEESTKSVEKNSQHESGRNGHSTKRHNVLKLPNHGVASQDKKRRSSSITKTSTGRKSVLKMLVAVVVAFFVCWAPYHAQRLFSAVAIRNDNLQTEVSIRIYYIMTYISGVMYYMSATVNPILYNIMSHRFRSAFRDTLIKCWAGLTCNGETYRQTKRRQKYYIQGGSTGTYSRRYSSQMTSLVAVVHTNVSIPHITETVIGGSKTTDQSVVVTTQSTKRNVADQGLKCSSSISNSSLQVVGDDEIELKEYVDRMEGAGKVV